MKKSEKSLPVWDLTPLYADLKAWQRDFDKIRGKTAEFAAFRGTLAHSPAQLKKAIETSLELDRLVEKVYTYSHLTLDQDTTVDPSRARHGKLQALLAELAPQEAFFVPELLK